ncbi:hypothetical protein, partial [Thermaurantiacus sp.]
MGDPGGGAARGGRTRAFLVRPALALAALLAGLAFGLALLWSRSPPPGSPTGSDLAEDQRRVGAAEAEAVIERRAHL